MGYRPRRGTTVRATPPVPYRSCAHAPVPVDLLLTGETVAWLCSRCLESCPAPPKPCRCESPEVVEVRTLGGAVIRQRCARCSGVLQGMATTW